MQIRRKLRFVSLSINVECQSHSVTTSGDIRAVYVEWKDQRNTVADLLQETCG